MREEVTKSCIRLLPIFLCEAEQELAPNIPISSGPVATASPGLIPRLFLIRKSFITKNSLYKIANI